MARRMTKTDLGRPSRPSDTQRFSAIGSFDQGGGLGAPRIVEEGEPSGRHCARRVGLCIVERIQEALRRTRTRVELVYGIWEV